MSEIEVKLIDIYKKISNIDSENDVDINSEISREVGFDSLGMVDFIIQIEEGFDIQIHIYQKYELRVNYQI
jgi:acyl carrier protein